jgi:glycosyltransferase involved in cell wall biosynthesis
VATVHDVFHCLDGSAGWSSPAFAERARRHYAEAAQRAHVVACVSASTRARFLAHHRFPGERTVVTPHGVDARFAPPPGEAIAAMRAGLGLPAAYALFVGAIAIRKNLPGLLRAWAACRLRREMPLVLAGQPSDDAAAVAVAVRELGLEREVRRLDFVDDAQLPALYAGAALFAFPSFDEGFGLPVLEAMACGAPVACSTGGALPEVAGGHARLADPSDREAWIAALEGAAAMDAAERAAARRHAAAYTWDAAAAATERAYRLALEVAGSRP